MCPRQGSNFLLLRQKKVTKEKATPTEAVGLGPTALRCSVFGARAELAAFTSFTALKQAARSQLTKRASARGPKPLRSSTPPTGPKSNAVVCCANFPSPTRFAHHPRSG